MLSYLPFLSRGVFYLVLAFSAFVLSGCTGDGVVVEYNTAFFK